MIRVFCVQYNTLDANLPPGEGVAAKLLRSAGIGFSAATAAAISSNWARVIKTCKQTSPDPSITYSQVLSDFRVQHALLLLQANRFSSDSHAWVFLVAWLIVLVALLSSVASQISSRYQRGCGTVMCDVISYLETTSH